MNPGQAEQRSFPLPRGTITIGRTHDNEICCLHKSLSRRHARVEFDGRVVRVTDLQSKNGVFYQGRRMPRFELKDGDSFRCGEVTFMLAGVTAKMDALTKPVEKAPLSARTLPSPVVLGEISAPRRPARTDPLLREDDDHRFKEKLYALIRASELLASDLPTDRLLEELIDIAVQVLNADRFAVIVEGEHGEPRPRLVRSFAASQRQPYSRRVVEWVLERGAPTCFADVSREADLTGAPEDDIEVRAAMAVPLGAASHPFGVMYADSVSRVDCFRPDDLAVFRALANLASVALEGEPRPTGA